MPTETYTLAFNERGSRTVRRNIDGIGKSAKQAQGASQLLKRSLGALGLALGFAQAIREITAFGQSMSTVKAITGATTDQFEALR